MVYYPGCSANYWEPQVGQAVVHILERNGFEVIAPKHQCCGVTQFGYGNFNCARRQAAKLVNQLFTLAEQGYDIVTACPSCSLAIKEDYPFLLNSEKAKLVSDKTYFLSRYLNELHKQDELNTDFNHIPLLVTYHASCHSKAQAVDGDSIKLMMLVPGIEVIDLDRGCCGMSGTAGFKRRYYETSIRIGRELFQKIKEVGAQIVATDCSSCKMQIEQAANVEVLHPIIILDRALP